MNVKPTTLTSVVLVAASAAMLCGGCSEPMTDRDKRDRIDALYRSYRAESFPSVPHVTAGELIPQLATGNWTIVDVRPGEERRVSIIPGAISAEDFQRNRETHRGRRIVTYCTIGLRSGVYAAQLRKAGFDACNLKGGILSWAHGGGKLVDDSGPTRRVHVYGRKWNLPPAGYEAVW